MRLLPSSDEAGVAAFQSLMLLVVLGSTIWVGTDANKRDFSGSSFASETWHWVLGTLGLWFVVFPLYLAKRGHVPLKRG
jgi:uncharacterized membrane protein YdcZ (DUF606 family)